MMKRSLELAEKTGVNLRGVLTWAFTFPDSAYFAGYRALSTNGIHLPVLNAFKLLGSLSGDRLPVESSGARSLDDLLENGVRDEPDVDALAALDGERIQILVWNYHDDIVDHEPAPVTLEVLVPGAFGAEARVTHTRVDATHGNAHAVWEAQGRPETPTPRELSALRDAMEPVVVEPARVVGVLDRTVSLSFELPRFGISLFTLAPSGEGPSEPELLVKSGSSCSCRLSVPTRAPFPLATLAALSLTLLIRSRLSEHARRARE